jgi:N-methylhydantoinase B
VPEQPLSTDPILATVVSNRLLAIARHMAEAMLQTSRSPIFQIRDMVTGIFTADGRWVATKDWIPVLAGSMQSAWDAVASAYDDFEDGDVFLLNDPYHGNNHPPDMTVLKPVFWDGELVFWTVSKGHHLDVGGGGVMGINPYAVDCWEDALRIPPVRLYRGGEYNRDVWELLLLNVRLRDFVNGDLHCQVGAVNVGADDLRIMLDKFGLDPVMAAAGDLLAASERQMRSEIGKLRDGVYEAERRLDNSSAVHQEPLYVRVQIRIHGDQITIDFTGTDPQVPGIANSPYPNTVASCCIALFAVLDPGMRMNGGSMAPIQIVAPSGSAVNAQPPAATTLSTMPMAETIVHAIWLALADAVPNGSNAGWSSICVFGQDGLWQETGIPFVSSGVFAFGGSGATEGADGWSGLGPLVAMGGSQTQDPELVEITSPVTVLGFGLRPDSAGPGRWRGGFGGWSRYRVDQDGLRCLRWGGGSTDATRPYGLRGGADATPSRGEVERSDGTVDVVTENTIISLNKGDVVLATESGGGGYGDPGERDPEAVLADVVAGLVTADAAARDYLVAVEGDTPAIDREQTVKLRSGR